MGEPFYLKDISTGLGHCIDVGAAWGSAICEVGSCIQLDKMRTVWLTITYSRLPV